MACFLVVTEEVRGNSDGAASLAFARGPAPPASPAAPLPAGPRFTG